MKDVLIKIKGIQEPDSSQNEAIEFSTDGKMEINEDTITIFYNEGEMLEGADIKTKMQIIGNHTVITERNGSMNSRLVVQKGVRNTCFYSTPYGELSMGIYGEEIENDLNSNGGKLKMKYSIDTNLSLLSKNEVEITVREIETEV
ncbi:MAG: DUF1934 domain-containing protein [Clostridia bacterium]|nr:DUF1934 domain-containing protein [Clostridia bacterium]MBP3706952.1 DUF1934 domain-containing protein [Clostridia bacterium]